MTYSILTILTEKKKRVGENWFIAFLAVIGWQWISVAVNWSDSLKQQINPILLLLVPGFISLMLSFLYFFSYKKCGTKLLTTFLAIIFVGVVVFFGKFMMGAVKFGNIGFDFFSLTGSLGMSNFSQLSYFLATMGIFIWWLVLSCKLRKINKTIQKLSGPVNKFEELVIGIRNVTSLEELDAIFNDSIAKSPRFKPFFSKEYNIRKDMLISSLTTKSYEKNRFTL
ncbi:MAG: hypothetical protein HKM07_07955 [Chlamydiae bacterium]|nr:hypothetical protein [Chlamydiota bacterium]